LKNTLRFVISEARELLEIFYRPMPAFALGAASVLIAVMGLYSVLSVPGGGSANNNVGGAQFSAKEPQRVLEPESGRHTELALSVPSRLSPNAVSFVSQTSSNEGRDGIPPLDVFQLVNTNDGLDSARLSRKGIRLGQVNIEKGPIEGLEADDLSILWIKAPNAFRLLQSKDRSAPPVIWVAKSSQ
jgi:hypothetical protein